MIRQILAQPFVPGFIDDTNGAQLRIRVAARLNQCSDSQIYADQVWIGAKIVTNHYRAIRFQLLKRHVNYISFDVRAT